MENDFRLSTTPGLWILLALMVLLLPLPWFMAVCVSSLVHELCHLAAVRITGAKVNGLRLCADGAYLETTPMLPIQSAMCSLAGPIGALALLLFARWMPRTALCAAVQSAYHLLPLYPLDGGRAFRSLAAYFGWSSRVCIFLEIAVMTLIVMTGAYLTVVTGLGLIPVCLSAAMIFRTCREKFLANGVRTGYNRYDYQ